MSSNCSSYQNLISIHALREEGDARMPGKARPRLDFYPRPPRGGRPTITVSSKLIRIFLSTPSARRATWPVTDDPHPTENFYPRPPRGGRRRGGSCAPAGAGFLSTPSARRATEIAEIFGGDTDISIHALREEGDRGGVRKAAARTISIHALREEGDLVLCTPSSSIGTNFYPRPPRGGRQR